MLIFPRSLINTCSLDYLYTQTVWAKNSHIITNGQLMFPIWVSIGTPNNSHFPIPLIQKPLDIPNLAGITIQLVTQFGNQCYFPYLFHRKYQFIYIFQICLPFSTPIISSCLCCFKDHLLAPSPFPTNCPGC